MEVGFHIKISSRQGRKGRLETNGPYLLLRMLNQYWMIIKISVKIWKLFDDHVRHMTINHETCKLSMISIECGHTYWILNICQK